MKTFIPTPKKLRITAVLMLLASIGILHAQPAPGPAEWSSWWFGIYGGANINMFSGQVHTLSTADANVAAPGGFTSASGLGLAIGGMVEFNPGDLLGGRLQIGYDNRALSFSDVGAEKLSVSPAYLTIDPALRLNLINRFFHLTVGPTIGINLGKGYEYTADGSSAARTGDLANTRSLRLGGEASVGYDIPLAGPDAKTQILLTPYAAFRLGQSVTEAVSGSTDDFGQNTLRVGLQLKFASGPTPPVETPPGPISYTVKAPNVITESRTLNETFPVRNYVFFDSGSTELPSRYKQLSSSDASSFKEEQLRTDAETGGQDPLKVRSHKQMDVYYNTINIFGARLRDNPQATATIVGSGNGSVARGKLMAQSVKNYLVSSFGIDSSRIKVEGRAMPTDRSGSSATPRDDKSLVEAENYRVDMMIKPPELLQPVTIVTKQEQPLDNDIVVNVNNDSLVSWTAEVAERGGETKTYGPFTTNSLRINSKELLGSKRESRYTITVKGTTKSGKATSGEPTDVKLVRADASEEQTGTRYSILFEFDESKTVKTYEDFLRKTVAPAIPDGAAVIIHGHTDKIGEPDYNLKLSQRRCEEAQSILNDELTKLGKKVSFDSYGFGEEETRALFNNDLPEQRYYNRTVVIEVVPKQ